MSKVAGWTRRQFLSVSGAAAAAHSAAALPSRGLMAAASFGLGQESVIPPPIVISGGIKPLFESNTTRPLRYIPEDGDFVVRNGGEFFNRPVYGPISDFRVDAGDRPEFSLYLPGHGGNLKLGFATESGRKWAADADEVVARYRPGRMIYEIHDGMLRGGSLHLELLTAAEGSGLLLKVESRGMPASSSVTWGFGGVSGRKGRRNGDIGCEVEPVSRFFQVRPEECDGNRYSIEATKIPEGARPSSRLRSDFCELLLTFPPGSRLSVEEFSAWEAAPAVKEHASTGTPKLPILTGSVEIQNAPLYLTIQRVKSGELVEAGDAASEFDVRSKQVAAIASTILIETPDPYLDAVGPALGIVAEGLWDPMQECVMHGCVAWRVALAGWRGPYVLDATGNHDRAKIHFRHWLKRQNTSPITTSDPATGPADPDTHLARKEHLLHSNGDLSGNHYDMNMVFFDVLLRHLRWTGDPIFAREIWPAFKRHLAWEQRLFRRTFAAADGRQLPLYEAYAAIWASDNLQYSGGGAAHSSAYNIFSFRFAATLAGLLHEDPTPYETEAELIHQAMQELLWLPEQGAFAESKDLLGPQTVYNNPAVWTVYHTIDSEVPTPRQAWQMVAERLSVLKHIPVHGEGVPVGPWYLLSCSDWLPYMWSLNLIVLAENVHFALAMWQAGMADEAYLLLKGNLFDSMYQGLCPGDFHMSSELDSHRQEAQRDFGDPTGITSRALVEGLFGVQPDLIGNAIRIRPGFPSEWTRASLQHPDFDLSWNRDGLSEVYEFTSRFPKQVPLTLALPARTTSLPEVTSGSMKAVFTFDPAVVGSPSLTVKVSAAASYKISLKWHGQEPTQAVRLRSYPKGAALHLPHGVLLAKIDDPQHCLSGDKTSSRGFHTVFANMHEGDCQWTLPISFEVSPVAAAFAPVPHLATAAHAEPIDLSPVLSHKLTEMFQRSYSEPRSPLCTLSIPDTLLGGWANIGLPEQIDDAGLRGAGGMLQTPLGMPFLTPAGQAPNCVFLSHFHPDQSSMRISLTGHAEGVYLLMAGSTLPQCSRMQHALVTVAYADGSAAKLSLRNPETWWPIEQDYLLDDYLFVDTAPLPPRLDLRSGETRLLDPVSFKGMGRSVSGGSATIVHLMLDPGKTLASMRVEVDLYGIVVALLAATLVRPSPNHR
jgi:hypothetical protein